jgi:hypothetical protein
VKSIKCIRVLAALGYLSREDGKSMSIRALSSRFSLWSFALIDSVDTFVDLSFLLKKEQLVENGCQMIVSMEFRDWTIVLRMIWKF